MKKNWKYVGIMWLLLLQVFFLPTGPNVQRLHSSQCCAFFLSSPYLSFIIQSMSFCVAPPSSFHYLSLQRVPSKTVSYPVLLSCSDYIRQRSFTSIFFKPSFVLCSVQLILSILFHIHISKASIRLASSCEDVKRIEAFLVTVCQLKGGASVSFPV